MREEERRGKEASRGGVRADGEGGPAGGWVTERKRECGKEGARVNEWARGKGGESECEREERNGGWLVRERQEARASERASEGANDSTREGERERGKKARGRRAY